MMMLDDPSSTARDISEMIGMDQAWQHGVADGNSVALGFSPACANLKDAVMRLGFKRIKTVVMVQGFLVR
jgi:HD-like signal output (HDOD) protein